MFGHILWTLAAMGGVLMSLIYLFQDKILYVSSAPPDARTTLIRPERFNIRDHEDLYIPTPDDISHRLPNIADLLRLVKCNVLIVEYRGYGRSTGVPSEIGLQIDAQTTLEYLHNRSDIAHNKIFVFGRSLGGAVAIDLAARNPEHLAALVVENSFTSVPDMVDIVLPFLRYFKFLSRNQWSSETKIASIKMPTLLLSGRLDELVPCSMMDRLYAAAGSESKEFVPFPQGRHMETWAADGYYEAFSTWLRRARLI